MRKALLVLFNLFFLSNAFSQQIDRKNLVYRHHVMVQGFDSLASLSVGNGNFAFTVDATGLQSFPQYYANGVALGTQSVWSWHSFPDTANYQFQETLKEYESYGHRATYPVQIKEPIRNKNAVDWFRQNPHRLQLGNIGFEMLLKNGQPAKISDIQQVRQILNLYTGEITSLFEVEGVPIKVQTVCHQEQDVVSVKIHSPLLKTGRIKLKITFPYPTNAFKDVGTNYNNPEKHHCFGEINSPKQIVFKHQLDTTVYYVAVKSDHVVNFNETQQHQFLVFSDEASDSIAYSFLFSEQAQTNIPLFADCLKNSQTAWKQFWHSGAAVDFSGSTDLRAMELERRIILSQYLTKIQCSSAYPPQETGLTYNSWYGKPHLEMHWWHVAHFALWGRVELLEKSLNWYHTAYQKAKEIAIRQGYEGVRWQKMTDNEGRETPSSVGAFLIWQQPHLISYAELCYRHYQDKATLERYKDLVFATADFMASYPNYDSLANRYVLGKNLIPAQERFKSETTLNPTFELAYWHWGLSTAQAWRKRLGLALNPKWQMVLEKLAELPEQDGKYLFTEDAKDSYTNSVYQTDHPAVLATFGVLPITERINTEIMQNTFDWIWKHWNWEDTWGWDFPMAAMTATRLNKPEKAIEALMMPIRTNTYLKNGHNYQDQRLTIYLPGNGALLSAIALLCGGYDGSKQSDIPKIKNWKIRAEGFRKVY